MEEQSKKSGAEQKKLIVAVIFLLIVIGVVVAILALLMQGDESIDPRYFQKASCEVENPSPIEANACLRADCTFVPSVCDTSCPFDYETDPVTKCQVSCECAPSGLYQGDIMFVPQQVKAMSEKYGYADKDDFDLFYGSTESDTILWNENEVNGRYQIGYVYETTIKPSVAKNIEKAMKMIAEDTCIDFVPHTNQEHYIRFDITDGCASYVGILKNSKTPQTVSIGWGCDESGTVHHELKHLLGFEHEHCRADRDAYITVKLENVEEGMEYNFVKIEKENAIMIGVPYDITSVMQYPSGSFLKFPGRYTVVEYGTELPINLTFSGTRYTEYDAFEINQLYGCLDSVTTATWTEWGDWSPCDSTCEKGEKYKYRRCENAEGKHVIGCPGEPLMIEPCSIRTSCPPKNIWKEWGEWGECDVTESQSFRMRSRRCALLFDGCKGGIAVNIEDCPMEIEPTKTWGPWSECSGTCNGQRVRGKLCNGQPCPDGIPHYGFCNTECGALPTTGKATWSQWTECTETCDGIRTRQRLCGDTFCEGSSPVNEGCGVGRCGHRNWMWSQWNECSATCEGMQTRRKICVSGECPGEESRECNSNSCSATEGSSYSSTLYTTTTTPGSYSSILYTTTTPESYLSTLYTTTTTTTTPENAGDWGLWASCSATCDGTRVRQRTCRTFCYNPETETEDCNVGLCSSDRGADGTDENTSLFDVKEDSVPNLCGGAGSQWYFGDFNGDGRTDAVCIELDGNVAIGHTTTSGSMTELHWKGRISPCVSADIYFGDINGDRRDDFVCKDSVRRKLIIRYTTEAGVFGDKEVDGGSFCTDPSDNLFALDVDGTRTMDLLCHFADSHIELRLNSNFRPF